MIQTLLRMLGGQMLQRAVAHGGLAKAFDWRLGMQLMRDSRVPARSKWQAVIIGVLALVALEVLELPLQTAMMVFLPLIGMAADFFIDGIEILAVPFLVSTIVLPFIAPRDVVNQIRHGRQNADQYGRVYDAASAKVR